MNSTTRKVAEIMFFICIILMPLIGVAFITTIIHGGVFAAQPLAGSMVLDGMSAIALSWISQGRV